MICWPFITSSPLPLQFLCDPLQQSVQAGQGDVRKTKLWRSLQREREESQSDLSICVHCQARSREAIFPQQPLPNSPFKLFFPSLLRLFVHTRSVRIQGVFFFPFLCRNKMVVLTNNEEQDYILIEERQCSSLPNSPAKRVSPTKKKQFYINQAIRNSDLTPRAKGKKSLRRLENTRYLANLLEKDECTKDDLEVCSNPAIPSIFTEACTNGNYIEPWNDFMNCSGEEQEKLLSLLELEGAKKKSTSGPLKDERNGEHLGFFERLLLHAVCQYMELVSASSDYNGSRQTEVVNKQEEFLPPGLLLSAHLEQMS
ncbi:hypothetical protein F7725_027826 [Dissostichus mawsoni]|uniref:R3H-associated N-terminal domain-containing protein n=1 Tax=Dissostichus mawsoni TaxID=36200 RepID=A0A7J5XGC2_DISMA|nr:hypothetical protein F7725_027826 [Dissostichus mawsoni]